MSEWQLCPKCLGSGRTRDTDPEYVVSSCICDVCHGNKLIPRPDEITESGAELMRRMAREARPGCMYFFCSEEVAREVLRDNPELEAFVVPGGDLQWPQ